MVATPATRHTMHPSAFSSDLHLARAWALPLFAIPSVVVLATELTDLQELAAHTTYLVATVVQMVGLLFVWRLRRAHPGLGSAFDHAATRLGSRRRASVRLLTLGVGSLLMATGATFVPFALTRSVDLVEALVLVGSTLFLTGNVLTVLQLSLLRAATSHRPEIAIA